MKVKLINLISAVRTLMRSKHSSLCLTALPSDDAVVPLILANIIIIGYELVLGG